jgi:hypothetical protein
MNFPLYAQEHLLPRASDAHEFFHSNTNVQSREFSRFQRQNGGKTTLRLRVSGTQRIVSLPRWNTNSNRSGASED